MAMNWVDDLDHPIAFGNRIQCQSSPEPIHGRKWVERARSYKSGLILKFPQKLIVFDELIKVLTRPR